MIKVLKKIKQRIYNIIARERYYKRDKHFILDLSLPKLSKSELKSIQAAWPSLSIKNKDLIWARIYKKERSFSPYFLCDYQYGEILKRINPIKQLYALQNKAMCDIYFPQLSWPKVYIRSINGVLYNRNMDIIHDKNELADVLRSFERAIIKPTIESGCGAGVMLIKKPRIESFMDIVKSYKGNFVIQEVVLQHNEIQKLAELHQYSLMENLTQQLFSRLEKRILY